MKSNIRLNENSLLRISQLIINIFALNILVTSTLFIIDITISWYSLPISMILAIIITAFCGKNDNSYTYLCEILCVVMILMISLMISGCFYDVSWDGNTYHKLAVGLLQEGWNPLKDRPPLEWIEGVGATSRYTLWVEAYCKQTWIWGASIYAVTGNIEYGKSYTIIAIVCAFFLTFYYLKKHDKSNCFCILFSAVAASNPIAIQQWDTYYIDGYMQLFVYILVLGLLMLFEDYLFDKMQSLALVGASMIVCGNIKFTGLLYGGVFCIVYCFLDCIKYYKNNKDSYIFLCMKEVGYFYILALITVFWAGNTSYLTNIIRHGDMTYPLSGPNKVDIMTMNSPFNEAEEHRLLNLAISLFSKMDNVKYNSDRKPVLKIPFSVDWETESALLRTTDARISGFGILFGGLFLVSSLIILVTFFKLKKGKRILLITNVFTCLGLTLVIKESWWARYAPYIFFIVLIAFYIMLESESVLMKRISIVFFVLLLVNNLLPCYWINKDYEVSKNLVAEFRRLKDEGVKKVYAETFKGIYFNLKDNDVVYVIDPEVESDSESLELGYRYLKCKIK